MRPVELGVLYLAVGLGCACALLARRRTRAVPLGDALLLLGFWPLYGPLLLARLPDLPGVATAEVAFLATLDHARRTPLGGLLPAPGEVRHLARRLAVAAGKVEEGDALLARPELSEPDALARLEDLKRRGASDTALRSATMRIQNIRRLRQLRDRFARELDEVSELLAQLAAQAEVVRLAGAPDAATEDLVCELVARVESLDAILDDEALA